MKKTIQEESFSSLPYYLGSPGGLSWSAVFVLPAFLENWWQVFGEADARLHLCSIWQKGEIAGIAPLQVKDNIASFIGSADVCDYIDFVTTPGKEAYFFNTLLDGLRQKGIKELDLGPLRPDSSVMMHLLNIARGRGDEVLCKEEDVFVEMTLPSRWDEYLEMLDGKQRHEIKRKIRRLSAAGTIEYRILSDKDAISSAFDPFLKLFAQSRGRKATFMTPKMTEFFRTLIQAMADIGLMRLGILSLAKNVLAMVMCLDYNDIIYLYNSAYDPDYSQLSPGILAKAFYIQDSIAKGKKKFDFLKGSEDYKYQMGGRKTPIYRCHIVMR